LEHAADLEVAPALGGEQLDALADGDLLAVGVGLRHQHQLAGLPARPQVVRGLPFEAKAPRLPAAGLQRQHHHQAVAGLHAVAAALADGGHAGQRGDLPASPGGSAPVRVAPSLGTEM
jgi:hypothetical protein